MKNLNKILIHTILLITFLILANINISEAATYTISDKNSDDTYTITVTFNTDAAKNKDFSDDGWTKTSENSKSFSKKFKPGAYGGLSITSGTNTESIIVAAPITLQIGEILDMSPQKATTKIENLALKNTSIAQINGMKITAQKAGKTDLTANVTLDNNISGSCTWNLIVEETSGSESSSGNSSGSNSGSNSESNSGSSSGNSSESNSGSNSGSSSGSSSGNSSESSSGTLTDFSSATFNLSLYNYYNASLEISGISPIKSSSYKYIITSTNTEPSSTESAQILSQDNQNLVASDMGAYVALNQDMYLWVYETNNGSTQLVVKGQLLTKPEISKYSNAFNSCKLTSSSTYLDFNYPLGSLKDQNRKINIKIGKITDSTIVQNIYNNQNDASFSALLEYAKKSETIYSKTLTANESGGYRDYNNALSDFDSSKIQNNAYYFLYVELDDENGKYIPVESVTLTQAITNTNGDWYLFFYGSNDFKWVDVDTTGLPAESGKENVAPASTTDSTVATTSHPQTGENSLIIIAIVAIIGIAIFFRVKSRKVIK